MKDKLILNAEGEEEYAEEEKEEYQIQLTKFHKLTKFNPNRLNILQDNWNQKFNPNRLNILLDYSNKTFCFLTPL